MTSNRKPRVVAHRGYALYYPENTLSAIQAAIDAGVGFVEIDVQMSSDGIPVLFHDEDTQRLCDVPGLLQQRPLAVILSLCPGYRSRFGDRFDDERIPTLLTFAALLAQNPNVSAFVEVKPEAVARHGTERTFDAVWSALDGVHAQCILISFDLPFLAEVRRRRPAQPIAVVVEHWHQLSSPAVDALRAEFVFCDRLGLPEKGMLRAPHAAQLVVYEVAESALAMALAARGVPMIETFECGEMLRALREHPL